MKRRGLSLVIAALGAVLFLLTPPALAHSPSGWGGGMGPWMHQAPGGPWGQGGYPGLWSNPEMLKFMGEKIGLSPEQLSQLRAIVSEGQRERQKLQGDLWAARRDFREIMSESSLNEKDALAKVEEVGRLRTEILRSAVNMRLKAEKVLTPKQREALREFILRGYDGRRGWYGRMGPWMQGGPWTPGMMRPWMYGGPQGPWMQGGPGGPCMMGPWMHGGPWAPGMMRPWRPWMYGGPQGPWMQGGPWAPEMGPGMMGPGMHRGPGGPMGQGMMGPSY